MRYLILVALLLAGCGDAESKITAAFPAYRGQPIEAVTARWGEPRSARKIDTGTIYTWYGTIQYASNVPATTTGAIGSTPVTLTTTTEQTSTLSCLMQVHTDTRGRIVYIGGRGNNGACETFADRL